ncbi:LCP family protein [Peribacillus sp. B-H-3]|uniref:LCP family protein n=1 Tax=Peribacillus sp. B-H-3 TaxID=3400420 RepID=UPI003B0157B8
METRTGRKQQKKKKKSVLKGILTFIFLIFLAAGGYAGFQYYEGLKQAKPAAQLEKHYDDFQAADQIEGIQNVLLLGIDARKKGEISRTDSIMVGQYDTDTEQLKLVSIMRDNYVDIPGHGKNKINAAFSFGGPELLRKTIEQNFGIDVNYYALVDFKGFEKIVDALSPEGVQIDVEKAMSKNIGVNLKQGVQKLHGKELLGYARFRHDARGDFGRVERQQKVIGALKEKFLSVSGVVKLPKMVGTIQPYIDTNMKTLTAIGIAKDIIINKSDIQTMVIPVKDGFKETRYPNAGQVLEPDLAKNKEALQEFLVNGNQETEYGLSSSN